MRTNLTKALLDSITCPPDKKRLIVYDEQVRSLELQVTPQGNKTFYLNTRAPGHQNPVRLKIGRYPIVDPSLARKRATEAARALLEGVSLDALRGKAPRVPKSATFGYWWVEYLKDVELRGGTTATLTQFAAWHKLYLAKGVDQMEIRAITPDVLRDLQEAIVGEKGRYTTANRVIDLVRNVYGFIQKRGEWEGRPPTWWVSKYPERARERYVTEGEIGPFLETVWGLRCPGDPYIDVILLGLYTGARRSCLIAARWDQIEGNIWSIPALQRGNKLKRMVRVPLGEVSQRVLLERREWTAGSPWVFPSDSKAGHIGVNAHKGFRRIRDRTNGRVKPGLSLHAMRHTFITYGKWAGIDEASLKRLAGHSDGDVHQRYIHLPDDRMLELALKVETEIHKRAKYNPLIGAQQLELF